MKRKIIIMFSMLLVTSFVSSQALRQGNFVIDPYYGFPNFGKSLMNSLEVEDGSNSVGGLGPWGLRIEYMAGDRFGITLDGIHNSTSLSARYKPDFIYNEDGDYVQNTENVEYEDKIAMNRIRIQVGLNYHFDFSDPSLDAFLGFAAGTNSRTWSFDSTNPEFNQPENEFGVLIPVSLRLRLGGRYYFNDFLGINFELGLGGPVLSAGLSVKI